MSPRGQAIPDISERLFRAGERVLMQGGPGAISARAVAREAGVATGVLYNHFEDLDDFLAALVLDRFRVQADEAAQLPALAGTHTVTDNLAGAALALLASPTLAVAELVRARIGLSVRVMARTDAGAPAMPDVQRSFVAYLDAEKRLGRIAADADTQTAALILVGAMHHLLLLHGAGVPNPSKVARRVATTLVAGLAPDRR